MCRTVPVVRITVFDLLCQKPWLGQQIRPRCLDRVFSSLLVLLSVQNFHQLLLSPLVIPIAMWYHVFEDVCQSCPAIALITLAVISFRQIPCQLFGSVFFIFLNSTFSIGFFHSSESHSGSDQIFVSSSSSASFPCFVSAFSALFVTPDSPGALLLVYFFRYYSNSFVFGGSPSSLSMSLFSMSASIDGMLTWICMQLWSESIPTL